MRTFVIYFRREHSHAPRKAQPRSSVLSQGKLAARKFSLIATHDRGRFHKRKTALGQNFRVAHSCVRENCLHWLIKEGVACLTFRSRGMENAKTWNLQLAATRREAIAFRQNNRGTLSSASLLLHTCSESLRAKQASAIYDQVARVKKKRGILYATRSS